MSDHLYETSLKAHLKHISNHIDNPRHKAAFDDEVETIYQLKSKDLTEENLTQYIEDLPNYEPGFWSKDVREFFNPSLKYKLLAWQVTLQVLQSYNRRFVTGSEGNQFAWKGVKVV